MTTVNATNVSAVPALFAWSDSATVSQIDMENGITESQLKANYFSRGEMNAIGRLASAPIFLGVVGHLYSGTPPYEEGQVFPFYDRINGVIRKMVCITDTDIPPVLQNDGSVPEGWSVADNIRYPDFSTIWGFVNQFLTTGETDGFVETTDDHSAMEDEG